MTIEQRFDNIQNQLENQILKTKLNNKFNINIIDGGINAPTKEEEAKNFQNMVGKEYINKEKR